VPDQLIGLPTQFGYACPQRTWDFEFDFEGVIKFDFENGTSQAHYYGDSEVSGEHVFAADPAGTAEDDGWLMSFVTDRATETSELVILDARDVQAEPVARVKMAARVPIGFHANWFAD
jgi:carotenoid cleavage dioxygenase